MNGRHILKIANRLGRVADLLAEPQRLAAAFRQQKFGGLSPGEAEHVALDVQRLITDDMPALIVAVQQANRRLGGSAGSRERAAHAAWQAAVQLGLNISRSDVAQLLDAAWRARRSVEEEGTDDGGNTVPAAAGTGT